MNMQLLAVLTEPVVTDVTARVGGGAGNAFSAAPRAVFAARAE